MPIWVIFGHDYLGLTYFQGIALVALPQLVAALLNVPAGALADRFGLRRVYWIGLVLSLGASVPYVLTRDVLVLAAFIPIAGLGSAMVSGSLDALVSSSLQDTQDRFRIATSHQRSMLFAARIVASLTGGLLYSVDPRLPFAGLAGATLVCLALSAGLPKDDLTASAHPDGTQPRFVREALALYRRNPGMAAVVGLLVTIELLGNMIWTVYQPALQRAEVSPAVFGAVFAALSAMSILGSQLGKRLMATRSAAFLHSGMFAGIVITSVGVAFVETWAVILLAIPLQLTFGMMGPVATTYVASRTPVHIKATALSILGVTNGFWVVASLLAGAVLDEAGIRAVSLTVAGGAVVMLLLVPRRALRDKVVGETVPPVGTPLDVACLNVACLSTERVAP